MNKVQVMEDKSQSHLLNNELVNLACFGLTSDGDRWRPRR
jgi:hypothetical protein